MLDRRFYWGAVALRLGLYIFLQFSMGLAGSGALGRHGGDTASYFEPINNLLLHGHYTSALAHLPAYAGRMPGYGAVYGLLRLVLFREWVDNALILLQMALALVALYYLGQLTMLLTRRKAAAYAAMLACAVSPFAAQADLYLLTESFAASALVLALWFLTKSLISKHRYPILLAGAWMAWLVFLRPILAPVPLLWAVAVLWQISKHPSPINRQQMLRLLLFAAPLAAAETAWTCRNWLVYHRLVPLQADVWAGNAVPRSYEAAMCYAAAVGDEPVPWNMDSIMGWLISTHAPAQNSLLADSTRLVKPASADSLRWVRQQFRLTPLTRADSTARDARVAATLTRWATACRQQRPWLYYGLAPLRLLYYLALAHGAAGLFAWPYEELSAWQRILRWAFTLWHVGIVSIGLWGLFSWRAPHWAMRLVRLPPAFLLLVLVLVFRQVESRYFLPVYPLVVLAAAGWGEALGVKLRRLAQR